MWVKVKEHLQSEKRFQMLQVGRNNLHKVPHPMEKENGYHLLENGFLLKVKELLILLLMSIIPMPLIQVIKKDNRSPESHEGRILKISSVILITPHQIAL